MSSIEIKNLSGGLSYSIKTPKPLPILPATIALVASSRSGKTNTIKNLFLRNDMFKKYFETDSIFIFCPTHELSSDYDDFETKYKFNEFNPSKLLEIINKQEECIRNFGKQRVKPIAIIIDDCAGNPKFDNSPLIRRLAMSGRHALITTVLSVQKLKCLERGCRLNLTHLITFRCQNMSEYDQLLNEYVEKDQRPMYMAKFKEIFTEKPYQFIYWDFLNPDFNRRIWKNFDEPIHFGS
jgi:hypothetical protein